MMFQNSKVISISIFTVYNIFYILSTSLQFKNVVEPTTLQKYFTEQKFPARPFRSLFHTLGKNSIPPFSEMLHHVRLSASISTLLFHYDQVDTAAITNGVRDEDRWMKKLYKICGTKNKEIHLNLFFPESDDRLQQW